MEEIVGSRKVRSPLLVRFLYTITPAVTGSCCWKKNILVKPYSEFVTVSDKAFIYFAVENNLDRWNFLLDKIVSACQGSALWFYIVCLFCLTIVYRKLTNQLSKQTRMAS